MKLLTCDEKEEIWLFNGIKYVITRNKDLSFTVTRIVSDSEFVLLKKCFYHEAKNAIKSQGRH